MDDDLAAFIAARLDEDETQAKGPPGWKLEHWTAVKYADKESGRDWRVDAEPRCVVDAAAREDALYIARHDPARVLREVEAKRAILANYKGTRKITGDDDEYVSGLRYALESLATAWSDHPDYRQEWAPGHIQGT